MILVETRIGILFQYDFNIRDSCSIINQTALPIWSYSSSIITVLFIFTFENLEDDKILQIN